MQVTCPNCGARYAVDPMAIGPTGRTVQCMRCSHRWRERPVPAAAAIPPRPQAVPDFVIRPPSYNSGLPALATKPARSRWGLWLLSVVAVVAVLGVAAWAFRVEIRSVLPPEWQALLTMDSLRAVFGR
jgi:predicted Zn finger-like uncharacterized protein